MTYEHAVSDGQLYDRHFARIRPRSTTIVRLRRGISVGKITGEAARSSVSV